MIFFVWKPPKKLYSFNFTNWMVFYFFLVKLKIELSWYFYQFYHGPCSFSTSAPTCATTIIISALLLSAPAAMQHRLHAHCPLLGRNRRHRSDQAEKIAGPWCVGIRGLVRGLQLGENVYAALLVFLFDRNGERLCLALVLRVNAMPWNDSKWRHVK